MNLVPEVGIEPTRTLGPGDFESPASTNFTTPAQRKLYFIEKRNVKENSTPIFKKKRKIDKFKNLTKDIKMFKIKD